MQYSTISRPSANCDQCGSPATTEVPFIQNTAPVSITKAPSAARNGHSEGGRMW